MSGDRRLRDLLSVIILTKDEEANLPHALRSLGPLGARVLIVDSGSQDQTLAIARAHGCHVLTRSWTNYAEQFQWGIDNIPWSTTWLMRLDADEILTPELIEELQNVLPAAAADVAGYEIKRRVYFWGRWIRHGGYYPTWLLRIWRRGSGRIESRQMDEHLVLENGRVGRLESDIIDENHKGLSFWTAKHNSYADREVDDMRALPGEEIVIQGQAGRRRWMKKNLYSISPRFVRAFVYWFLRYVVQLGFLDGKPGLVFHFLQAFWYRFLVDAKLEEEERRIASPVIEHR
jgi:glycosyltransferase involved in cell wall biosynthesis